MIVAMRPTEDFFIPIPHCQCLVVLNPVTSNPNGLHPWMIGSGKHLPSRSRSNVGRSGDRLFDELLTQRRVGRYGLWSAWIKESWWSVTGIVSIPKSSSHASSSPLDSYSWYSARILAFSSNCLHVGMDVIFCGRQPPFCLIKAGLPDWAQRQKSRCK
jgi:hypothetical protein